MSTPRFGVTNVSCSDLPDSPAQLVAPKILWSLLNVLGNAVAHYFKFHSLDEIRAEVARQDLCLRFDEDLSPLFRPVRVGKLTVGNALCIQPMEGCDGTDDGRPDELTFRRYRRFGAGGAKLIWGEAAAVALEARANPRQLVIGDSTIAGIAQIYRECRQAHVDTFGTDTGLVVGLQLTHSGRYSHQKPLIAVRCPLLDPRTREAYLLSDAELDRLPDLYVKAARLARDVGFQFVDVKQCHRYLLNELLGARGRPGPYGGSFENRTRLARTIIQRIRDEVPDLLIATRLNVFDGVPHGSDRGSGEATWGTDCYDASVPDLSEPLRWIAQMRCLGVDLVNVSLGNPYASPHLIRPFEVPPPDGYETPEHPLVWASIGTSV